MKTLQNIFWNEEEKRIRAGWRLIIQLVFFLVFLSVFAILDSLIEDYLPPSPFIAKESILLPLEMFIGTFLSVWLISKFIDKRKFFNYGLKIDSKWWYSLAAGFIIGAILQSLIFINNLSFGWIQVTEKYQSGINGLAFIPAILIFLLTFILVALSEELQSRGFQFKNLSEGFNSTNRGPKFGIGMAIIITSLIFGLSHLTNPNANVISTTGLLIAGLMYASAYILTGQLAIPIGLHFAWNFFEGCVYGFPVSGINMGTSIIMTQYSGPELFTGGAFGPEAGLTGIAARFIGILLICLWVKVSTGRISIVDKIASYNK